MPSCRPVVIYGPREALAQPGQNFLNFLSNSPIQGLYSSIMASGTKAPQACLLNSHPPLHSQGRHLSSGRHLLFLRLPSWPSSVIGSGQLPHYSHKPMGSECSQEDSKFTTMGVKALQIMAWAYHSVCTSSQAFTLCCHLPHWLTASEAQRGVRLPRLLTLPCAPILDAGTQVISFACCAFFRLLPPNLCISTLSTARQLDPQSLSLLWLDNLVSHFTPQPGIHFLTNHIKTQVPFHHISHGVYPFMWLQYFLDR